MPKVYVIRLELKGGVNVMFNRYHGFTANLTEARVFLSKEAAELALEEAIQICPFSEIVELDVTDENQAQKMVMENTRP
ncbi:MAG: hypothetical protein Q4D62_11440 [Planctomycetia bacterium]|nr:hypothetical protein [Planctomycetia bacterium]